MNQYYLTLVFKNGLEEKERKDLLDSVKKRVLGSDGKVEKEDSWGSRDLAYPIKKQTKGYYIHLEFQTSPNLVKGLDKNLKIEEDILRFLLIRR